MSSKLIDRLLGVFLQGDLKEEVSGDLQEAYLIRVNKKGSGYARFFLFWELLISLRLANRTFIKLKIGQFMFFQNFIKTGFRFLWKTRRYSFINILGLTLGIAVAGYTWLFVSDQFSYDGYHQHADNSYRIGMTVDFKGDIESFGGASFLMGEEYKSQLSGIVAATQVKSGFGLLERKGELEDFVCHYVNPDVFDILDFNFIQGSPSMFGAPNDVFVSSSFFQRMEGAETIKLHLPGGEKSFQVVGIFEDVPANSSLSPDMLVATAFYQSVVPERRLKNWMDINMNVLVRLEPGMDPEIMAREMTDLMPEEERDGPMKVRIFLQPITKIHTEVELGSGNGLAGTIDRDVLMVLVFTGILCLLISTLNFANYSVGNYLKRVKEVGIRKTLGADKRIIFSQFLIEVGLSVALAGLLALFLQIVLVSQFAAYIEVPYGIASFFESTYLLGLLGVLLLAILLSGVFPAAFLSGMGVLKALKGYKFLAHKRPMSKLFLSFQAALSIFMLLVTFTTQKQLDYLLDFDLGYKADNLIFARLQNRENTDALKAELLRVPGVNQVSFNSGYNGTRLSGDYDQISVRHLHVDPDFLEMVELQIVAGRNLNPEISSDEFGAVLISETLEKQLGFEDPIGEVLPISYGDLKDPVIVGIVKDYHFQSPRYQQQPLIMYLAPVYPFQNLLVQTTSEDPQIAEKVAAVYEEVCAPYGFQYSWMSEFNRQLLDAETKVSKVSFLGSLLAIFLSALGLLGVLGTNIEKRLKEVTIHKINGASVSALYKIFFRNFIPWLVLGLISGIFPAFYLLNDWLTGYANSIELGPGIFLVGILTCGLVFLFVMLIQLSRINRLNPVNFLRDE